MSDGIRKEDMNLDLNWNSKYSYKTNYDDKTWEITLQIPLGELRFKPDPPYNWYIILSRYKYKTIEYYSSPMSILIREKITLLLDIISS